MLPRTQHILIVEDEASLAHIMADELREHGFSVSAAANGVNGLAIALAEHPDLILLDLLMPKMDGGTLLRELRRDPWGQKVPVIILTNVSDATNIDVSLQQGVRDYIVKADWELADIVRMVKKRLAVPA